MAVNGAVMVDDTPTPEKIREALERVARGEAGLQALASTLALTSGMITVISEAETAVYLNNLSQRADAAMPTPAGLPGPDGRVIPRGFTSHDTAGLWARVHGFAHDDTVVLVQGTPWTHALRACVHREDTGLVIDEGTSHMISLARVDILTLLSLLEA
jgi:hypothetical protein